MTEWLMDTNWEEIRDYVLMVCKDTNIDIEDHGTGPWNPIRIEQELDL
jgi:acetone carboxylase gamma subunit